MSETHEASRQAAEMSVVLYTPTDVGPIRRTLEALRQQAIAGRLEMIVVAPRVDQLDISEQLRSAFAKWQMIDMEDVHTARSAGVVAATTPIIAFTEDHVFPDREWAEHLLSAHQQWDVVGPVMVNPAPSRLGQADFLLWFSHWMAPRSSGQVTNLPGHNTSYKREQLLEYGDNLRGNLINERALHYELENIGCRMYLESRALIEHLNISQLPVFAGHAFDGSRLFGAQRSANWSLAKRAVYVAGSPLIPAVRFARIVADITRSKRWDLLTALPWVFVGTCVAAVGETVGYLAGVGNTMKRYADYETLRINQLSKADRAAVCG